MNVALPRAMGLFRRKGRDREGATDPSSGELAPAAAAPPAERSGSTPAPVALPQGSPPPLPRRGPAERSRAPTERFARCFVCGSPLDAGRCPQCRIAWVD